MARFDGRAAEQVGEDDHAVALSTADRLGDVLAAALPCRRRGRCRSPRSLLRPDDMLHRGDELGRKPAMGHQHQSNHSIQLVLALQRCARGCRSILSRGGEARSRWRRLGENPAARNRAAISIGDRDRAVAPSRTAERNGHVTFARGPVAGNPAMRSAFDAVHRLAPGRLSPQDSRATGASSPVRGRSSSIQCGLGRKRMSNTRSAVRGMPRAKANDMTVSTGWSASPP